MPVLIVAHFGRILRENKRGKINAALSPILERLILYQDSWLILTTEFERKFGQWVGSEHIVRQMYSDRHYQRIPPSSNFTLALSNPTLRVSHGALRDIRSL